MDPRPVIESVIEVVVTSGESPKRLDVFLAGRNPALSRAALQRLIEGGQVAVNGGRVKPSYRIRPGDRITLRRPRPEPLELQPEPIPLVVLYEDEALLVIDKPAGLVVHPAPGHWSGTLVHALLHHFGGPAGSLSSIGGRERPGLVHRLDKETSGTMVVAKTDEAHRWLSQQFKGHTITRIYDALVWAVPRQREGVIELAIGRDTKERKKFSGRTARPKASATGYRVVRRFGRLAARIEATPRTGRTHQIRVHLASIGHPLLGDVTYGGRKVRCVGGVPVGRVMLHARTLGFVHPSTGRYLEFSAPLPADMRDLEQALEAVEAGSHPLHA